MRRHSSEKLLHFIQRFYQAIHQPDDVAAVMTELGDYLEAPYTSFQVENPLNHEMRLSIMTNYDPADLQRYGEYYVHHDPWTREVVRRGLIGEDFTLCQSLVSDKDYFNSEFYQDWGRLASVRHAVGTNFDLHDGYMLKIALQRHDGQQAFDQESAQFLNFLRPHIKHFVRLSDVFSQQQNQIHSWQKGLDLLRRPLWIVNASMRLVYHNAEAEQRMAAADSRITSHHQTLMLTDAKANQLLVARVQALSKLSMQGAQRSQLSISDIVSPLQDSITIGQQHSPDNLWLTPLITEQDSGWVMITASELLPGTEQLRGAFGLSERQAQLCLQLCSGRNLQDSAQALNISISTARNVLAVCFRKLGVTNQSELIIRLLPRTIFPA